MRIFLDANILFSAANPHSHTHRFVRVLLQRADCLTSRYAVEEARRNLAKHFPEHLPNLEKLHPRLKIVTTITDDLGVELKMKDRPILGGAIAGQATHLLTGDRKDFGALFGKTVQGVKVVTPAMLAEELIGKKIL